MALWLVVAYILVTASGILYLTFGPLKQAKNVQVLRTIAIVHYVCALVLIVARLLGRA